jgi:NAD(P)H-dependent flavin oxidoreductase YrpB (nitropropane dioxygenase family)
VETAFTRLVGCRVPLQQAGMPQVATPELAAAVADAGALGMVVPSENTAAMLEQVAARTSGVFGINFLVPFLDLAAMEAAASRARVVEFFYAAPAPGLVARVHEGGALAAWQVGSVDEACAAVDAGCDFVIAQGTEAGGHVRGELPLLVLLDQVLDHVEVPVIGAGSIGTARAMAAVLAVGAAGARVGTRFVASAESGAHPTYIEALLRAEATDTVLTTAFSVGWPGTPHRVCVRASMRQRRSQATSWARSTSEDQWSRLRAFRHRRLAAHSRVGSRPWRSTPASRSAPSTAYSRQRPSWPSWLAALSGCCGHGPEARGPDPSCT